MDLSSIVFKTEYRSFIDDLPKDFYALALSNACLYQRAVGFFSSSSLASIRAGIEGLLQNGGHIQLVASPRLSQEDIEAIKRGYDERDVIESALVRELDIDDNANQDSLVYLSKLIADGILDIKIAFLSNNNEISMYHEKLGIISDGKNAIAFSGSMNESENAFKGNYEAIDVFCSWTQDSERVFQKQMAFKAIWDDYEPGIKTIPFPDAVKRKLLSTYHPDYVSKAVESYSTVTIEAGHEECNEKIYLPSDFKIRDYQIDAIEAWASNGFCGIYDMATGTGKTLTALASIERLYRDNNKRLAVLIICPYQHLVEQWTEDIVRFGMDPIVGYSTSPQKNWKRNLAQAIRSFNLHVSDHFCFVTTIDSLKTKSVFEEVLKLSDDTVFVVDEAHNAGAISTRKYLPPAIKFRLGLSATIDRYNDDAGTEALKQYFGPKCITYSLRDAIEHDMLTHYNYHPVVVCLSDEELEAYLQLTAMIGKNISTKGGKVVLSEYAKRLLIKRARIVAGARSKIDALRQVITPYKNDSFQLIYCGATKVGVSEEENELDEEIDQISAVSNMLGNELNMRVGRFTALESAQERVNIRQVFSEGKLLQALVAIKCLDEGVNIPSIKNAYILASSTNPKEYIQRRGRVLRKFPGKTKAEIFDFITLPFKPEQVSNIKQEYVDGSRGLIKRELIRMMDFAELADNPSEANDLIFALKQSFNILNSELNGGDSNVI